MRSIITNTVSNNSDPGFWTASDLPILKSFTTYSEQINTVLYLNTFYFKGSKFSLICNRKCALDLYYASFKRVLKGGRESWIKKWLVFRDFAIWRASSSEELQPQCLWVIQVPLVMKFTLSWQNTIMFPSVSGRHNPLGVTPIWHLNTKLYEL